MVAQNPRYYPNRAVTAAALARQGSYGNSGDILDHVLYDSLPYAATTARTLSTFFSTPIGGTYTATTIKTLKETNMSLQGQLPKSQNFICDAWSLAHLAIIVGTDVDANTVMAAIVNLNQASTFELHLAGREYDTQMPGSVFFPSVVAIALASAANAIRIGDVVTSGWVPLGLPVTIEGQANFSVLQKTSDAVAANVVILNTASDVLATQVASLQVRLKGVLTRGK